MSFSFASLTPNGCASLKARRALVGSVPGLDAKNHRPSARVNGTKRRHKSKIRRSLSVPSDPVERHLNRPSLKNAGLALPMG